MRQRPALEASDAVRRRLPPTLLVILGRRLERAAVWMGRQRAATGLSVRVVEDREMSEIHLRYAGIEGPTDVLSFPASWPIEPTTEPEPLGDLVLNWDAVCRQARGIDIASRTDEATVLAVHGLAHLLGHDHVRGGDGRRMHEAERRALRRLGVSDIARSYDPALRRPS